MEPKGFSWVALVGVGLAAVVAVSAATALAARSAASPFELVFTGRYAPVPPECVDPAVPDDSCFEPRLAGTFTSRAPFCASGTTEDVGSFQRLGAPSVVRRYTCVDDSGSLTLSISNQPNEYRTGAQGEWAIVEGTGRYEHLRGKGIYTGELLSGDPAEQFASAFEFQTKAQGFADADSTPPSIAFTSANPTKLRSAPGAPPAYRIRVAFSLRDDAEGNPVAYKLKVTQGTQGRVELASKEGMTDSGSGVVSLRVEPFRKGVRSVGLHLRAWDPIGNEQVVHRALKLPR